MRINILNNHVPDSIKLLLIIGLPGTGKSTLASNVSKANNMVHIEADDYFINKETGEYHFDKDKLQEAHHYCLEKAKTLLQNGNRVVVSNTFTTRKERSPYLELGYKYAIHTAIGNYSNTKDIPDDTLTKMSDRWEPYHDNEHKRTPIRIAADLRVNWPITVTWGQLPNSYKSSVFFDRHLNVIESFTRYCLNITDMNLRLKPRKQAHVSQIDSATGALKALAEFMRYKHLDWDQLNDAYLEEFREWEYERITNKSQSRDDLSRKRTVNKKLREIYNFFLWAQEEALLIDEHIGWEYDSNIRSKLPYYLKSKNVEVKNGRDESFLYPLCYKRIGSSSGKRDYIASDRDLELIKDNFKLGDDNYGSERNVLLTDLADAVGWRQGSIGSLTTDMFSDEVINSSEDEFVHVMPPAQKFGYTYEFEVPIALALRINRHIKTTRATHLNKKGIKPDDTPKSIWLSSKTGHALNSKTITDIFSKAFKDIGAPKGSGIHSIRRKFTNDELALEIETRRSQNLSTAPEDVMLPVARKLGHKSKLSQETYADATKSLTEESTERKLQMKILKLQSELMEKERELNILKKQNDN